MKKIYILFLELVSLFNKLTLIEKWNVVFAENTYSSIMQRPLLSKQSKIKNILYSIHIYVFKARACTQTCIEVYKRLEDTVVKGNLSV